jgi:predicted nucleic acid-binding protein
MPTAAADRPASFVDANIYPEDMQDGLVVDGRLRIVNPFK